MKVVPSCYKCNQKIYFDNKLGMVMDYLFDWMIVVNLIVVILNIEKQVLTNLKSVTGVEKIFFFDRNYVSISGK